MDGGKELDHSQPFISLSLKKKKEQGESVQWDKTDHPIIVAKIHSQMEYLQCGSTMDDVLQRDGLICRWVWLGTAAPTGAGG